MVTKKVTKNSMGVLKTVYGKDNPLMKDVSNFSSIRSWGDKNTAITHDGEKVERTEHLFLGEFGLVKCVPYELHFVYEHKTRKVGRWATMCTCGSPAGIISYKDMSNLMSPELNQTLLACLSHTTTKQNTGIGKHADGSTE